MQNSIKFLRPEFVFFTVYGPWGRPDMAPYLFMNAIVSQSPINVYNNGKLLRDFTYIDDIVEGLSKIIDHAPITLTPYQIYNIGGGKPTQLFDFIAAIENATGKTAIKKMFEMQSGDVYLTYADTSRLEHDLHFKPKVNIQEGINRFYEWFLSYTKIFESVLPNN